MKIDRHNYEEFFILYMDNELGSDERRMVETFVLQHPDLKEELDLLLQYKFTADTEIVFPGKEELIKINGETPITLSNYEEWLVLYIDNELNTGQQKELERFIAANPSAQKELALLQRSKLQPEQIIFAGKESLYRREEKVKALPVRWWRAAAAVLILALGLTALIVFNNKPSVVKKDIVTQDPGLKDKSTPQATREDQVVLPKAPGITTAQTAVTDKIKTSPAPSLTKENKNMTVKNNNPVVKDKLPANLPSPVKKEEPIVVDINNKPTNNLPQPLNNPNIIKNNTTNDVVTTNSEGSLTSPPVTNVIPASYNLEEGGKNKKNRGLFRKIARTFEKRTNMTATDDDRLLVGGLAFKLK